VDQTIEYIEDLFHPVWLDIPREFEDRCSREAEDFNTLLDTHLPSPVADWTCDFNGWIFVLDCGTLEVRQALDGTLSVKASSDVIRRKYLDAMRVELRQILDDYDVLCWSPTGFAVVLLQLIEGAVAWKDAWNRSQVDVAKGKVDNEGLHVCLQNTTGTKRQVSTSHAFDASTVRSYESILANPHGGKGIQLYKETRLTLKLRSEYCKHFRHCQTPSRRVDREYLQENRYRLSHPAC
jgi:hypothetical protein